MPKETIKQGHLTVIEEAGKTEVRTLDGKPTGQYARRAHRYEVGEVLNEGDYIEEGPTFGINWTKMGDAAGGYAQLNVSIPRDYLERLLKVTPEEELSLTIYSDNLSRAELNRMVTLGRHVRDSAHGQDA